jgi:hypothetical protein
MGKMQERGYLVFCEKNSGNTTFIYARSTRFTLTEAAGRVMIRSALN